MIPTAEVLANCYRVYIPDLPGYGKSGKPRHTYTISELADALAAWMDATGLEKATLLGNSMGCQIIANFALRHPTRIQRAIFVGPTMDPQACTARQSIGRWLLNIPGEPLSLFPVVMLDTLQMGLPRFVQTFRYALRDHIEEHLPHMHIPTLVVRGSRDTVIPLRWAKEATQLLPDGRLIVIEGAAHDTNYNSPQQLAQAVHQFINETPTSPLPRPLETPEPPH
jgi:pimeloyl-ACP methyl ester carboxylesterase